VTSPLITTIIPTFRRPDLLRRAVESVRAQTFEDFKICIYDNASGDNTEDVARDMCKLDKRIHYIKRSSNIGPGPNMVQAVASVDTQFFSLLNDDDFLLPSIYGESVAAFEQHAELGFVCSKTLSVDVTNGSMQYRNRDWDGGLYQPSNFLSSKMFASHFIQTGVVMRTNLRDTIGPFDLLGNDALFMTMAAAATPFVVIDAYRSVFTFHATSYSIAHGLSSEPEARLYEAMVSSISFLVRSNLPEERKFHLMMLVTHYYREILNIKSIKGLQRESENFESTTEPTLPSGVTMSSITLALHQYCPSALQSLVRLAIRGLRNRRAKGIRRDSSWNALPHKAHEYLLGGDYDSKKFMTLVKLE
jgi:glycosyltransferase involved in cell wall biosynthesis